MVLVSRLSNPDISIHSLTRRLTLSSGRIHRRNFYFNSQPHKEADLSQAFGIPINPFISIHSLTRRLTV